VLDSLAPARRQFVLAVVALAGVAAVVLAFAVLRPLTRHDPSVTPVEQSAQPPVLLVPGYGGSTSSLRPLAAALRTAGRYVTIVHLAGNGTGDLNLQAGVVQHAVRRMAGAGEVDLVGYSAGGVIVRLWFQEYGGGSVARRIVTLGSPHHGTDLASFATDLAPNRCPAACRQLATGSDLMRRLNDGDETPPGPYWVSIWTTQDRISTPPDTASLEGALDIPVQRVCPGRQVDHDQLPADPAVIAMVLSELRRTPPVMPRPSVCTTDQDDHDGRAR
jgi:triacylglycerol lipase